MRAANSDARVAVGVSSCVRTRLLSILVMPERAHCLVLIIPECRHVSSSSHRLFSRRRTYLSSSPSRRSPQVGVSHIDGRAPSLSSSSPLAKHRQQPPSSIVCGKHQHWRLCASSLLSLLTPPPGMRTQRTKDGCRWSANCRRRNQRCQLRAWNRRLGAHRRPLWAWHR